MKFDTATDLAKAQAKAVTLKNKGAKMKQILAETGLNHSQAESALMAASFTDEDRKWFTSLGPDEATRCVAARRERKSWGWIAVMAAIPESKVRKHWADATGLKSQGQRINKGGRFYYGDRGQPLYDGDLRPTGTDIPVGAKFDEAIVRSRLARLTSLTPEELRNLGADYGVPWKKGDSKAKFAQRIIAASRPKEEAVASEG